MERMVRKQIYIKSRQEQKLKRMVMESGLSEAELIRQAIDAQAQSAFPRLLDPSAWLKERQFIASWIAQGPVNGKRTWQREDLYER